MLPTTTTLSFLPKEYRFQENEPKAPALVTLTYIPFQNQDLGLETGVASSHEAFSSYDGDSTKSVTISFMLHIEPMLGFPGGSAVKTRLQYRNHRRRRVDPWVGKIPWRRAWQPTPVFLPRKSHRQEELGRLQSIWSQRVRHD